MLKTKNLIHNTGGLVLLFILSFSFTHPHATYGQLPKPAAQEPETPPARPDDSLGRRNPRGTVAGFIESAGAGDYARASRYLNLRGISRKDTARTGPKLAQALQRLLDERGNIKARSLISTDSTGSLRDELAPDLDLVGTAKVDEKLINIYVEKTEGSTGGPIWLFAAQTVRQIPLEILKPKGFDVNRVLPSFLENNALWGIPIGYWLAMLVLVVLAYLVSGLITALAVWLLRTVWYKAREVQTAGILHAFVVPIRIYVAMLLFVWASQNIGLSITVRQRFSDITLVAGLIAFLLLLWRLIDVFSQYAKVRLLESGQSGGLSAVLFLRRGIKLVLIAFGIIAILNIFGLNVTSGLAALGIGGIALALGAQKTIENFVGSLTIIADQPLRVGDFCKVDDTTGTVEQIGIRSTRIRTNTRTLVIVPNGQLAALKIENFAYRDRILFNPTLGLRYETTPDQIRYLLSEIRQVLNNNPDVGPDPARVRFTGWENDKLTVEIFGYINVRDYNRYLEIKESLALKIMEIVAESGTGLAFSNQTLYISKDTGLSEEKAKQAEAKVQESRSKGEF